MPPKKTTASPNVNTDRLRYFSERQNQLVETVRELVEIESPSDNKPAVDRIAKFLASRFESLGGRVHLHPSNDFGDSLQIDFGGPREPALNRPPVLLLGHYDTVYALGTLARMPCKIENGRLRGPGVLDMKSGIGLMLHAIEALQEWHGAQPRPVTVFLVSDEEVGSYSSRKITETLAKQSAGVLVLEPAAGLRGAVKTARKGVGEYKLRVKGVAAHAGLDPGKGHSAILELARQIAVLARLNNLKQGLSVNPGVITGGTDNHLLLIDVTSKGVTGKQLAQALDRAGIVLNYNSVPFDPRKPFDPSGVRIGTPAVTSRGMGKEAMLKIAEWIDRVTKTTGDETALARVAGEVKDYCAKYPAPGVRLA